MVYDGESDILYVGFIGQVLRCIHPAAEARWEDMGTSIGDGEAEALYIDKERDTLYAGCMDWNPDDGDYQGLGACADPEGSPSWKRVSGSDNLGVVAIVMDEARNALYLASWVRGFNTEEGYIYYRNSDIWRVTTPDTVPRWESMSNPDEPGVKAYAAYSLAFDASRNVLYADCSDGVFECPGPDTSEYWNEIRDQSIQGFEAALFIDSVSEGLFASCDSEIWYTPLGSGGGDGGEGPIPAGTWYLAEGATAGNFDCWVLVMNPDEQQTAKVKLTFLTKEQGRVEGPTLDLPPGKRHSFHVDDYVTTFDVSTLVSSENGVPVVAERAMYDDARTWAHDSVGYSP